MKPLLLLALCLGIAPAAEPAAKAPAKKVVPAKKAVAKKAAPAEKPLPTPTQANVRYGEHERNVLDFWRAPTQAPAPDQHLEGVELERFMQSYIAALDEEQRLLIVLRDVEELSYEEICAITSLPEGTVKSRLHRARMALRKQMLKHM